MKKIILIGAGGHAKVVAEALELSKNKAVGFVDHSKDKFLNLKKISQTKLSDSFIISVGGLKPEDLKKRQKLFATSKGEPKTVIHPKAIVSTSAKIGKGSFIAAGVIINASAVIGDNCIINTGAIIEHDAVIADGCHIAPGATVLGNVIIGKCSMIGAGAVVVQGTKLTAETFVKANGLKK